MPHFKRKPRAIPLELQPRDIEIIKLVYSFRFASVRHIAALIPGSYQRIQRRLQALFHNGYLDRPRHQEARLGNRTQFYIYALGEQGARLLEKNFGYSFKGRPWTDKNREVKFEKISHDIMIADFRTALTLALRQSRVGELIFWEQRRELADSVTGRTDAQTSRRPVRPDAWFAIRSGGKDHHFFLEADNSTMRLDRVLKKMQGYFWYWMADQDAYRGKFQRRRNTFAKAKVFRVLTIAKSPERVENLAKTAKQADPQKKGSAMFCFACTQDYSLENPMPILGKIWTTARDSLKTAIF